MERESASRITTVWAPASPKVAELDLMLFFSFCCTPPPSTLAGAPLVMWRGR